MPTVLIADDRVVNRQYLASLLAYCGHLVLEAGDGSHALQLARREPLDLIIPEIIMPGMHGCESVRRLRQEPATAAIPVIFYTATYRLDAAPTLAANCGVEHILPKPCEPQKILD